MNFRNFLQIAILCSLYYNICCTGLITISSQYCNTFMDLLITTLLAIGSYLLRSPSGRDCASIWCRTPCHICSKAPLFLNSSATEDLTWLSSLAWPRTFLFLVVEIPYTCSPMKRICTILSDMILHISCVAFTQHNSFCQLIQLWISNVRCKATQHKLHLVTLYFRKVIKENEETICVKQ